ncbi:SurA N-terminal domain-containing protein [Frateuria hangzhouensis]|uniref:SurA N-terminal domain-containing protein n=1 Tax=Frateuria hangzhouensis TaxID=2995589 RepID=UPI002260C8D8|nr:SurA N-terminal domain-containing protein [Frateuria sp. STR12]MCX7512327.1 SurA N-terminal domain-containing protein [Frateuria sp. STR12]
MLQSLRDKMHGWPSIVVLGVAVFAMSFFGIEGYFTAQTETFVAKVGKREISQQDFQNRMNDLRQQASAQLGDQFDPSVYEKPEMKERVLGAMIDQQLLLKANDDLGLRVSDAAVRGTIASIPAFQVNGQFDATSYRAMLAGQRKTPAMFEDEVRSSMAISLIPDALAASTVITDEEVDRFLALRLQRRDLRYAVLPRPALTDSKVTDAQVQAYYKQHQDEFMAPEQVAIHYVEVDAADLQPDAAPTDEELRKRYADEKQRFVQPEQRLVSHILIDVPKNASPEQQKAALTKAQKIAAEASPGNFAKLASKDSADLGSRRQGGDLGWLEQGVTNKAFDDALFSLQKGQISKPVLSDEGYHILWLRDVRSGQAKPFEEVRDQLVQEVATAGREHKYNEIAGKLADKTYQTPSSLEPAAQALDLPVKSTDLFTHEGDKSGIAADPKVVKAAFSDDVLVQGNNSGLIDLGNDHSVVIHVDKHVPAAVRPLAEVRDTIEKDILDGRVAEAAKKRADAMLARLEKGESMDAVAATVGAPVQSVKDALRVQQGLPEQLRDEAFLQPHPGKDGKPQFAAVALPEGAYALIAVDKVQDGDLSKVTPEQRTMLRQSMIAAYGNVATDGFIDALKAKTEIKIAKERL